MHILLINDDGYTAPGLRELVRVFTRAGHKVSVCAPDRERSAVSHAITITSPLQAKPIMIEGANGWAVDGMPADCARLGMYLLRHDPPDFAVSGINRGPNLGGACIYSGTVNAAMEASMTGCPALATSLRSYKSNDYDAAARVTLRVVEWAVKHPLPLGALYNLNVPDIPYDEIKGVRRVQKLAPAFLTSARYEEFVSEYNYRYYFLTDGEQLLEFPEDCDDCLNADGWATLSALTWDIVHAEGMENIDIEL